MHGAGPVFRTLIGRANTWQLVLIAGALIAVGALLVALGQLRGGIIGIVGVLLLSGIVRQRLSRRTAVRHNDTGEKHP